MSDVTIDMSDNSIAIHQNNAEPWKVTLVDTGEDSMTGGRLRRVRDYLKDDSAFCFTYGDGVSNIDISALLKFHDAHNKLATMTATRPPGRYGALSIDDADAVREFQEKPEGKDSWINGGFFVLDPSVIDRIAGDDVSWEGEPLSGLAADGQLMAFRHEGFWQPMDTLREKNLLNDLWSTGKAPWKVW